MKNKIDMVTLSIIQNSFRSISEEMSAALINTAHSTNIKDRRDCSCAVYNKKGEVIAQSEIGTPLHLGVMPVVVKTILNKYKEGEIFLGDQIILNEPYPAGPGHLNDITLLAPVFYDRKLVAFVANQAHHVDVGGFAPGSMPFGVSEIFQVGLQIPPIKIMKKGKLDEEIMNFIVDNVRTKSECRGDMFAQVAANNVGINRLIELFKKYKANQIIKYMKEILDYSEKRMIKGIKKIPEGEYGYEDYLEGDGFEEKQFKIKVNIKINKDSVKVDFKGTSNQAKGPINSRPPAVSACVYYAIKCIVDPELPPNNGTYRPIKVIIPEGTLLNSKYPAAVVHSNINTSQRIVDVLLGALIKAVPEKVTAACSGSQNLLIIGGIDPRTKKLYTYIETIGGGQGGMHDHDGMDAVHTHMTNTRNSPVEVIETNYPLLVKRYSVAKDSEGSGEFRGGLGIIREIINLGDSATITLSSDRKSKRPWGVFGGKDGASSNYFIMTSDKKKKSLPSKVTTSLRHGEKIVSITPGGGGWGNPFKRDPKKVLKDVKNGFISMKKAKEAYGVKVRPKNMKLDLVNTKKLRSKIS